MENLVECLEHWVDVHPDKTLFNFLDGRGGSREQYTYSQFYQRILGLANQLAQGTTLHTGDRVLLVYPPGLEMIVGFFACLDLGVIPVPVCAPLSAMSDAGLPKINRIARDCGARLALTTNSYHQGLCAAPVAKGHTAPERKYLECVRWLATDTILERSSRNGHRRTNPILFLQYTSGSTGDPKGVTVTHANVLHNARAAVEHCPVAVSWLPQYHDMGLIGHYLYVVVLGGTNHGFSPFDFLKRPALWLQTISRVRATMTAAPNFAYGYCLREDKVPETALQDVDLSSLKRMLNAAEPVNAKTYTDFYLRFARYGLSREAHEAGYGLAENTLAVSLRGRNTLILQKDRLQRRQVCIHKSMARNNNHVALVSCGQPLPGLDVRIVDSDSRRALGENSIGEIWISGESKCAGYWQRPEFSQSTFFARIEGEPNNPNTYLRTGDLGFLHEGELFVCGRIKDMIIVHGTNYYPQDVEAIIATEFPELSPSGPVQSAAFAVAQGGEERLVVVVEVRPRDNLIDPMAVAQAIRSRYFIDPYQVVFVPPSAISKTTSGKVARSTTRDRWMRGALPVLASYTRSDDRGEGTCDEASGLRGLFDRICERYGLSGVEEITLTDVGLDSLSLVDLTLEIQMHFERRGLADLVSELDARFLQRLSVAELSQLLEVYENSPTSVAAELRPWLEARQQADDAHEVQVMRADAEWIAPAIQAEEARDTPRTILLTGGTGFFGPFLLESLLRHTTCEIEVLIRATDQSHGRARLMDALRRARVWTPEVKEQFQSRVHIVCGDLGVSQLGLSDPQWQCLAEEVDSVVHNGAQVNYVLSYNALRPYNVGGTRELMRLAATSRKKPFHLISSTFIHGWLTRPIAAEHEYNADMEELDFGYAQSKCVAEHLVLNAERQGQPVRIYRPTLITASSRGVGSMDDIFVRLLAFMIKYGVGVDALNQVSFLPADLVSDHIARIFALKNTTSTTLHITPTTYHNIVDITESIREQFGYAFTYFKIPRFIEEMNRRCTPDDLLYPLLVFMNRSHRRFEPMEHKRYDNRHYRAALEQAQPEVVEPRFPDTVAWMVEHMLREGLIPGPRRHGNCTSERNNLSAWAKNRPGSLYSAQEV